MGESKKSVWKDKYLVRSYEVDVNGRVRFPVIFNYLLNSTWNHAEGTEFSYTNMLTRGEVWALSRFMFRINRYPKWNDEIIVETWGKGSDRFFALRDYIIHSEKDGKLAAATSYWLILNKNTYRPQKLDFLLEQFPFQFGRHELEIELEKLHRPTSPEMGSADTVRFGDLDVNKHVGAARYTQWLMDGFPIDLVEKKDITSFEINFISEAKVGDAISTLIENVEQSPLTFLASVARKIDNKELCTARVVFTG